MSLSGLLWVSFVVLVVAWLIGTAVGTVGAVVNVLLALAVIVLLYNLLIVGRPAP